MFQQLFQSYRHSWFNLSIIGPKSNWFSLFEHYLSLCEPVLFFFFAIHSGKSIFEATMFANQLTNLANLLFFATNHDSNNVNIWYIYKYISFIYIWNEINYICSFKCFIICLAYLPIISHYFFCHLRQFPLANCTQMNRIFKLDLNLFLLFIDFHHWYVISINCPFIYINIYVRWYSTVTIRVNRSIYFIYICTQFNFRFLPCLPCLVGASGWRLQPFVS